MLALLFCLTCVLAAMLKENLEKLVVGVLPVPRPAPTAPLQFLAQRPQLAAAQMAIIIVIIITIITIIIITIRMTWLASKRSGLIQWPL